ncbi:hypothetical protein [Allorhizobium ampelinum]|uniref:hypothetical protein n=1 Tax=Allorhizobium ampelinum TaxID=3025782 RepID=UPI000B405854|nr:hypothetical protein [Allorhizobium ampelinum]NTA27393.1 hypothetical protein [Allorhizobium ampelinum]OVE94448.1 hypothetical protein B7W85_12925 [Allorhizobium ampelinum]
MLAIVLMILIALTFPSVFRTMGYIFLLFALVFISAVSKPAHATSLRDKVSASLEEMISCVAEQAVAHPGQSDAQEVLKQYCAPKARVFFASCDALALAQVDGRNVCPMMYAIEMSKIDDNLKGR